MPSAAELDGADTFPSDILRVKYFVTGAEEQPVSLDPPVLS